ncbi:MAG: Rpn family recombination-promoting nuclease/putative transposase [Kiritimatiellae bacterium]|nr:Rpn family recombination-promoting nuclease/putative transposase [Kiritimatiellia bacterium]
MARYLDPKADVTFKKVFGEHKNLVMSLLNALLPLDEGKQVESIEYLPSELVPRTPTSKNTIVDVWCEETGGRKFIVEMQMNWTADFRERVLFNASKAYVRQLDKSEQYNLLQPVYALNFVNKVFEPGMDGYYHYYRMVHSQDSGKVLEGLHLVFIELPKFKAKNLTEKRMQVLWLRFLTEIDEKSRRPPAELLENPQTNQALEILEESAYSEAEMLDYDRYWDQVRRDKALMDERDAARAELNEIYVKLDEAHVKLDEAHAKLDAATERLRQTVFNLKEVGMSVEQISKVTGLKSTEVETLWGYTK